MPAQKRPFTYETYSDPNYGQANQPSPSIAGLREALQRRYGIEPGSRLDMPLAAIESVGNTIPSGQDIWRAMAKAPAGVPYSREAAVQSGAMVPLSASPYRNQPQGAAAPVMPAPQAPPDPLRGGRMSFAGGSPELSRTPGALSNFAELAKQFSTPGLSAEELYRGAFADPASRAPGSTQYMQEMLGERTGASALAEEKMRQPAEVARITAGGGLAQQESQSRAMRDVANINQGGAAARLEALQSLLAGGGGGMTPGSTLSISGVGSIHTPAESAASSSMLNRIADMRYAAEQAKGGQFLWSRANTPAEMALKQSISNFILTDRTMTPDLKDHVMSVLNDPTLQELSSQDIVSASENEDGTPLDPQSQQLLLRYLQTFRGR